MRFLRHGDFHTGLLNNLEATEGHPVKLYLETNVADLDCEKGIIQILDGRGSRERYYFASERIGRKGYSLSRLIVGCG